MLYERYAAPLLLFVLRLTDGDRLLAEDIVQETLLRAWRNAHRLGAGERSALRPWLVGTARRLARCEPGARPGRRSDPACGAGTAAAEAVPVDETDRVLEQLTVTGALRTLSPAHREILVETYFRDRAVSDVAGALGLPLGTAKSRTFAALRALRVALERQGITQ